MTPKSGPKSLPPIEADDNIRGLIGIPRADRQRPTSTTETGRPKAA